MAILFYSSVNISRLNFTLLCPSLRQQVFHNLNKLTQCFLQIHHRGGCQCISLTPTLTVGCLLSERNPPMGWGLGFEAHSGGSLSSEKSYLCQFQSQVILHVSYLKNVHNFFSCKQKHFSYLKNSNLNYKSVINPYISAVKSKHIS